MSDGRIARTMAALQQAGLGALVLMPAANLRYLSGLAFHQGSRVTLAIIPADGGEPCLVLPALEESQARATSQLPLRYYPWHDADGPTAALQTALATALGADLRARPLAIEYTTMRVMELRALEAALPGLQTVDATDLMAALRMVKDEAELALMVEAVRIIEAALYHTIEQVRPGVSERQLAAIIADQIVRAGGEGESFGAIVASGPNGANPHHNNSDRIFLPGDMIIIDCGARYQGYISDITRTVALGEPGAEARRVYELVLAANMAGRAMVRPGISPAQIDEATRTTIVAGGYGEYFMHRTGHGIGLDTHEPPYIHGGNQVPLAPGTTFTIEPGIYLPGKFGVRIEDDMVVTDDGGRSLTSYPSELLVIPT